MCVNLLRVWSKSTNVFIFTSLPSGTCILCGNSSLSSTCIYSIASARSHELDSPNLSVHSILWSLVSYTTHTLSLCSKYRNMLNTWWKCPRRSDTRYCDNKNVSYTMSILPNLHINRRTSIKFRYNASIYGLHCSVVSSFGR